MRGAEENNLAISALEGIEHIRKIITIDQSPISRTPRSSSATHVRLFNEIRNEDDIQPHTLLERR